MQLKREFVQLGAHRVPWLQINHPNTPQTIHFAGANGFPVASYLPFFEQLATHYCLSAMDNRGAWPQRSRPPLGFGMPGFAKDWLSGLEQHSQSVVIGMGHSHGAQVTALAALQQPERFSRLVLIEPATLPNPWIDLVYRYLPKALIYQLMPFIKRTRNRQREWPSRDAFIERYQNHPTYRLFERASLEAYASFGLKKKRDAGFELVFDPSWEDYIFRKIRFAWHIMRKLEHPTLLIRGANSSLLSSDAFKRFNQSLPSNVTAIEFEDAHHLLPQEQSQRTAEAVLDWLSS